MMYAPLGTNFSCSLSSTPLMVPFSRRSRCFINSRCSPTIYSVLPRHTRRVKVLYVFFPLFSSFFFFLLFLDVSNSHPPSPFPLRSPSTMLLMCSPFPTHPFLRLGVHDTFFLRPLCCPMKTPLKCFPVKMFSIPPFLTLPIPQIRRLLSSPPLYLSAPVSFFLLLIYLHLPLCIFEFVTRSWHGICIHRNSRFTDLYLEVW